ncbi:MAG TPA: hypothetical protein VFE37_01960 [Chloroflexota bacterium]|nr:hypothetical protein [Chloroflexota bacterium]
MSLLGPVAPATLLAAGYALLLLAGAVGLGLWSRAAHARHRAAAPREAEREAPPLAPWPHAEIAHFHHGLALMLVLLAGCIAVVGLARHHAGADWLVLGPVLLLAAGAAYWLLPAFLAVHRLLP